MNAKTKVAKTLLEEEPMRRENLTLNAKVVASPDQLSAILNGEVVILNLQSGIYFGLENVAARIWSLIQEPMTCINVAATLYEEYEMEQSQIEADVMRFVHRLLELELIEISE
jgi:hypothetical protein